MIVNKIIIFIKLNFFLLRYIFFIIVLFLLY
nr:MAG TPA: hypothetical protein [Caudoviricetes sp.]